MITIPLQGGAVNAHQILEIQLGDNTVEFRINWVTTQGYWSADLYVEGVLQCAGVVLLPGDELIGKFNTGLGLLVLAGEQPTLDNLGNANQLVWVPNE